jgi:excisionase family DNA binding protein
VDAARRAADRLKTAADANEQVTIAIGGPGGASAVPLPPSAVVLLREVLEAMASRTPVSLIPQAAELTTQEAADFLNVSRPHLIAQLKAGKLPFRKVGSHRRIRFVDLAEYDRASRAEHKNALLDLSEEAKRLGLE